MSKNDQLRALREAKYARAQAAAGTVAATRARPPVAPPVAATAAPKATPKAASKAAPTESDEAVTEALCGHRNMGGRTCTREAGHAARSHRYS